MRGRVLIIAGSDSSGGAGIQADIKAVTALDAFAATAITALTAQNTQGVFSVHPVPEAFIAAQMERVLSDIGADCLKTGMLHSSAVIETVTETIHGHGAGVPLVVDPVMVAKGGHALLQDEAVESLKQLLLPRATLLTPNIPEAELLSGLRITDTDSQYEAALALLALGPQAVLLKGGHLDGPFVRDLLLEAAPDGGTPREFLLQSTRLETRHTHGTGCTLASAIAAGLAQGLALQAAVERAHAYVHQAIARAPGLGQGHGPLNHAFTVDLSRIEG